MTIDGVLYAVDDMTTAQNEMVEHIHDLEDQLRVNEFKHTQLIHGRTGYIVALKASLGAHDDE